LQAAAVVAFSADVAIAVAVDVAVKLKTTELATAEAAETGAANVAVETAETDHRSLQSCKIHHHLHHPRCPGRFGCRRKTLPNRDTFDTT